MGIKCECGQSRFQLYKNKADKNANAEWIEWYDRKEKYFNSFNRIIYAHSSFRNEEDGLIYDQAIDINGDRFGAFCLSDMPRYINQTVYKIICPNCKTEYILYDNSKYGYDGCICSEKQNDGEINFYQVKKKILPDNLFELKISIENNESYEDFLDAAGMTNLECDFDKYSNAFSWIIIYAYINGRKTKLYEEETS